MSKAPISKKQKEVLDYLKQEILTRGFPPSVREICEAVHLKSTSSVHAHLESLEKKGYIKKDATKPRAIEILDDDFQTVRLNKLLPSSEDTVTVSENNIVQIPVIGNVAAGQPLLAVEQIESYLPMPVDALPNAQTFYLKVKGESMINAGIFDGDFVLCEQTSSASDGQIVVALVGDSATVKTFYKEKDHVRLQPENDYMEPILVYGDLQILGKVIGLTRFMK